MIHSAAKSAEAQKMIQPGLDGKLWLAMAASIAERDAKLIKLRRRLHATPEASGEELATTQLVAETLDEAGLQPRVLEDDLGVLVDIDLGAETNTFIAVRSELDCVRVNDDKQVPYASTRPGLCHACGHDVHTSVSLASAGCVARWLEELRRLPFHHNLRFVFQPSEETAAGARSMIKQGVINGVEAIIAVHVDPFVDTGAMALRKGAITSGCKHFIIHVRGRSGHSARPHEAIDPIPAAANIVSLAYQLCPRAVDARRPVSLTVASIHGGAAFNAIPDEAVIDGTLRTTRSADTQAVQKRLEAIVAGVAQSTGCEIEIQYEHFCPPTDNADGVIDIMARAGGAALGDDAIQWLELPSMGAEDFAFYQELIPGAIVRLGAGYDDGRPRRPLHSSLFDINEAALNVGTRFMTRSALELALAPAHFLSSE